MRYRLTLWAALLATPAAAQDGPRTGEERQAYAWFRTLGYPDVGKLEFGRIFKGWWSRTGDEEPIAAPDSGFLIAEKGDTFTVFTIGLRIQTFKRTGPRTAAHERVAFEPVALERFVKEGLDELSRGRSDSFPKSAFGHLVPRLDFRLFTLAVACAERGHFGLAHEVWKEGCGLDAMKMHVVWESRRIICENFADPKRNFSDQLKAFRRWHKLYGGVPGAKQRTLPYVDLKTLERMAAAEGERTRSPPKPLAKMTVKEQVAELIYRLQYDGRREQSAHGKLVELRLAAVPALIEALDDTRLSRTLRWQFGYGKAYHRRRFEVATVGELACGALGAIAGQGFAYRRVDDEAKSAIDTWWKRIQAKGRKQVLLEDVSGGGTPDQAEILVEEYPDVAVDALIAGIGASECGTRDKLVEILSQVEDERVTRFLLKDVRLGFRGLAAARALRKRKHPEAVAAMIDLWSRTQDERLISFLAHCGSPATVRVLARDLPKLKVEHRVDTVSSLLRIRTDSLGFVEAGYGEALEALLAGVLLDTDSHEDDSRVCDVAATALARRFPEKHRFDRKASTPERDRQCVLAANVWRRAHGLEPLPVPEPLVVQPMMMTVSTPWAVSVAARLVPKKALAYCFVTMVSVASGFTSSQVSA